MNIALVQVLGAVAYGEKKAYEGARGRAVAASDPDESRVWRQIAAEELRHHKGFVRHLESLGADPERAMRPYAAALDHFHSLHSGDEVSEAVWSFLGEGIARDLLEWLRAAVGSEAAAFLDTVLADEERHEALAATALRDLLARSWRNRLVAMAAPATMLARMAASGGAKPAPFGAFLSLGRANKLVAGLAAGFFGRLRSAGIVPV